MAEQVEQENIIIRNYRTSDYEATLEILKSLEDRFGIGFSEDQWRKSSGLRQFKPNLKRITLIAESKESGEVMGMGMLEAVKNSIGQYVGYLDNWATKEKYIGAQVGKILAEKAIKVLLSWGCNSIRIKMSYNIDKKIIDVIGKIGFKLIQIILEKKFDS